MMIRAEYAYKIIGIKEDPKKFLTSVILRRRGENLSDGNFEDFITLYGTAIYGVGQYQADPDNIDRNQDSVYGAGIYGTVKYGSNPVY